MYLNTTPAAGYPHVPHLPGAVQSGGVAQYAARVAKKRFKVLQPNLVTAPSLTSEDIDKFVKADIGMPTIAEIVKGLVLANPELLTCRTEVLLTEVMLQISPVAQRLGKDLLVQLMSSIPLSRILSSISIVKNHDGDVERQCNAEWKKWRGVSKTLHPDGARPAARARQLITSWTRSAQRALDATELANQTRAQVPPALRPKVPKLALKARGKKLTTRGISAVNKVI